MTCQTMLLLFVCFSCCCKEVSAGQGRDLSTSSWKLAWQLCAKIVSSVAESTTGLQLTSSNEAFMI